MGRRISRAAIVALLALVALAPAVSGHHNFTHTKCSAMVNELNEYRSPDVDILYALCIVGRERAQQFAAENRAWHDGLEYAINRLEQLGWGWGTDVCALGEVIGQVSSGYATPGRHLVHLWLESDGHDFIASSYYDRAGGSYEEAGGLAYAAFYVVRSC